MRVRAALPAEPSRADLMAAIRAAIERAQSLALDDRACVRSLALLWAAYDELDAPTEAREGNDRR